MHERPVWAGVAEQTVEGGIGTDRQKIGFVDGAPEAQEFVAECHGERAIEDYLEIR